METSHCQCKRIGQLLCRLSLLVYLVWLLLPTLQEALHSYPGLLSLLLLAVGLVLDQDWFKINWWKIGLSAVFAVLLSWVGASLLRHGVSNPKSFIVSRSMFWYPVLLANYCLTSRDFRLDRRFHLLILLLVGITAATTIFWNAEGMIHRMENGNARCYSRLIYDRRISEAEISSYNLRNIGSLPFIYAEVFLLPLLFIRIFDSHGRKRIGYIAFLVLNVVCIGLSQFTFAIAFAGLIIVIELLALLIRSIGRGKVKPGIAMLIACTPFLLLLIFIDPLSQFAFEFAKANKLSFLRASLKSLYEATRGGVPGMIRNLGETLREIQVNPPPVYLENGEWYDPGRLQLYLVSLGGFLKSPFVGSMNGSEIMTGYHSDLLDALTATGLLGTLIMSGMVLFLLWPCGKAIRQNAHRSQFGLAAAVAVVVTLLTTYLCCREISAVFFVEMILLCQSPKSEKS